MKNEFLFIGETDDVCLICFDSSRRLNILHKHLLTLFEVLTGYKITTSKMKLCWSCIAIINKFHQFRLLVKKSQNYIKSSNKQKNINFNFGHATLEIKNFEHINIDSDDSIKHESDNYYEEEVIDTKEDVIDTNEVVIDVKKEVIVNVDEVFEDLDEELVVNDSADNIEPIDEVLVKNKNDKTNIDATVCPNCKEKFETKFDLGMHQRYFCINRLICDCCNKAHPTRKSLIRHLKGVPNKNYQKYHNLYRKQCQVCKKWLSNGNLYKDHLKTHQDQKDRHRWPCKYCSKSFLWRNTLYKHQVNHRLFEAGELHCKTCSKTFTTKEQYQNHMKHSKSHGGDPDKMRRHSCSICNKNFYTKNKLIDHISFDHEGLSKYRCEPCDKVFKNRSTLSAHLKSHNESDQTHLCHICGKNLRTAVNLRTHVYWHKTVPSLDKVKCPHCGKQFANRNTNFRRHLATKHGESVPKKDTRGPTPAYLIPASERTSKYKCDFCESVYRWKSGLNKHIKKRHEKTKDLGTLKISLK